MPLPTRHLSRRLTPLPEGKPTESVVLLQTLLSPAAERRERLPNLRRVIQEHRYLANEAKAAGNTEARTNELQWALWFRAQLHSITASLREETAAKPSLPTPRLYSGPMTLPDYRPEDSPYLARQCLLTVGERRAFCGRLTGSIEGHRLLARQALAAGDAAARHNELAWARYFAAQRRVIRCSLKFTKARATGPAQALTW